MQYLFIVLAVLLYADRAQAFTCDDAANTCTVTITATEPTKTASGALLNSQPGNAYKQTNIKTQLNAGNWATIAKPATSPAGGGSISQNVTFATAACQVTTLNVKLSGTNVSSKEGVETAAAGSPWTKDRTQDPICVDPPAAVTGGVN